LKSKGIREYSIFLDTDNNALIGVFNAEDPSVLGSLPANHVMKKWWAYMKDIMESNENNSPVSITIKQVF